MAAAPMTCLRRSTTLDQHRSEGTLTTDLKEIDDILHGTWGNIAHGTHEKFTDDLMIRCAKYLHRGMEFKVGDIDFHQFKILCLRGGVSAPGLHGWSSKDLALFPHSAIKLIVNMLNASERGDAWHENMYDTRAVFLSEDPSDTMNTLEYIVVKIVSTIHAKWASYRNHNIAERVETWDNKALHSGVSGQGTQDAWYQIALLNGIHVPSGDEVAGRSTDIYKRFDQLSRQLLERLATHAGMPERLMEPCLRFHK